jgi:hypothetical protein
LRHWDLPSFFSVVTQPWFKTPSACLGSPLLKSNQNSD